MFIRTYRGPIRALSTSKTLYGSVDFNNISVGRVLKEDVAAEINHRRKFGNAAGYAKPYSSLLQAVIRIYNEAGNLIETQEHAGDFKDL